MKENYVLMKLETYDEITKAYCEKNVCDWLVKIILPNITFNDSKYSPYYLDDGIGLFSDSYAKDIIADIVKMLKYVDPERYEMLLNKAKAEKAQKEETADNE